MTTVIRLVAAATVSTAASLPALAEETKAASDAPPIPTLHCEFKLSTPALATALARPEGPRRHAAPIQGSKK